MNHVIEKLKRHKVQLTFYIKLYYQATYELLRQIFKNTAFKFIKCDKILEGVNNENSWKDILHKGQNGPNNHRGITETEAELRKIYYWPSLKSTLKTSAEFFNTFLTLRYP